MNVIDKLASSLNRRDEVPNQNLARELADKNNTAAIREILKNLTNKNKNIQSDCIKVLYEIAVLKPRLVSEYLNVFLTLIENPNNRLVWGAMMAIDHITLQKPKEVYNALPKIIAAADKGSVISRDHCVGILIKLSSVKEYAKDAFDLLSEQLKNCPVNQLAMYAENASSVINETTRIAFIKTLQARLKDVEKDSQQKRIEKVIKKLSK
ncbi:MAG TPA: hypothetical protein VMY77_14335 [Chitinophagaceae bacterium]|nr:hypothetical protein [Chitinophagaceae bacterium]